MQNTDPTAMQNDDLRATDSGAESSASDSAQAAADAELLVANLREELLRQRADIDNQRKRLARDIEQSRKFANERLLSDLLPVCDSLERGLEVGGSDGAKLREGMELTFKLLLKVLENHGMGVLDPRGAAFDPEFHQAMTMVANSRQAPGTVVNVLQKGYRLNERLLRPAMVAVAAEPNAD